MRDIYTPSPGLPQDLSCRKKCVTLKCDSQKLLVIQEDLEACLPPIATFSHHRESRTNLCSTSVNKSVNLNCKKRSKQTKHNNTENIVYCDLPQCPSFINRKPSKQRTHLKHHSLLQKNHLSLSCSQCGKSFSSKENLRRHMNMHLGLKPYICQICHRAYSRTSERSQCMKKHRHKETNAEQVEQSSREDVYNDWSSSGLSALQIEDKINQSRPRPYVCQICDDHRAYTDPSSLRKHMRSFHADLKNEKQTKDNHPVGEILPKPITPPIPQCDEPISLVLETSTVDTNPVDVLQPSSENVSTLETTTSFVEVDPVYTNSITPSSYYNVVITTMASDTPIKNIMITNSNDSQGYPLAIGSSFHPHYTVALTDSLLPLMPVKSTLSMTPVAVAEAAGEVSTTTTLKSEYDNEAAVDLCNSALCLQVYSGKTHSSIPSTVMERVDASSLPLSTSNLSSMVVPQYVTQTNQIVNNGSISKRLFYSNSGLDLTDTQYFTLTGTSKAIDLSADPSVDIITMNPIDLSAPHQCTMFFDSTNDCSDNSFFTSHTIWDPEPGFSFTDLLLTNNDSDDCVVEGDMSVEFPEVIMYPENSISTDYRPGEVNITHNPSSYDETVINSECSMSDVFISSCNNYFIPSNIITVTTKMMTPTAVWRLVAQSDSLFSKDSISNYSECINLTPFGEFLVWSAEASSKLSTRKRRYERRMLQKQLKKKRNMMDSSIHFDINDDDNDNDDEYDWYNDNQDSPEMTDSPITLDDIISEQTTHQGASKSSVILNEKLEESLPYIPQHLPRPTPIEWRRPGEYIFVSLPETVPSEDLYSVVLWLTELIQQQRRQQHQFKSLDDSDSNVNGCIAETSLTQRLQCCFVYKDLWDKGYYISTSSAKMGGDFLLYQGDPLLYHGSHIVTVCNPKDIFLNSQLLVKLRIANSLKKVLVLATVPSIDKFTKNCTQETDEVENGSDTVIVSDVNAIRNNSTNNNSKNDNNWDVIYLSLQYMSTHSNNNNNNPMSPRSSLQRSKLSQS
uniref:tRNA-intron lyase n=1 Tax=Trichobilharzia regenti TaxID=157069 RepID=A0AA85K283_TRIRE|nr:unnamed protein product [Trichobilharzia regenti]